MSTSRGGRDGVTGVDVPGTTSAQESPAVWLPERPLPWPRRFTVPNRGDTTSVSRVAGRSLHRTMRSGRRSECTPVSKVSATRSTALTAGAPSASVNVSRPDAISSISASASPGSTIPSRSRPRRFTRT
jgi:hypothetical protein